MRMNDWSSVGSRRTSRKRVGRGPGSGLGKTAGRGQKGQKSRSGGFQKTGFEGGQMPLQRRVPKRGFRSKKARFGAEVRLDALARIGTGTIDLQALKTSGLISTNVRRAKIIASGTLEEAVQVSGVAVTAGARKAIEAAGGSVQEEA